MLFGTDLRVLFSVQWMTCVFFIRFIAGYFAPRMTVLKKTVKQKHVGNKIQ